MISCRLLPQALEQMWSTKTLDHWIITTYITTTKSTSELERDAGAAEESRGRSETWSSVCDVEH